MPTLLRRDALRLLMAAGPLAACASPNPQLYTLGPVPGTPQPGGPATVVLHQVSVARYLERPEIVRSSEGFRLDVLANEQWGEPLAQMIGRVLADDLMQRMPGTAVFSINGAITAEQDVSVEVNIRRMDLDASGALAFAAQAAVTFTDPRMPPLTRDMQTTVPVSGPGTGEIVRAMSVGIGELADLIAGMLRTAPRAAGRRG